MTDAAKKNTTPKDDNKNYQVLARRYRPTKFSELMGQDVLVQTLINALESGRLAHAFIFTGVRGVGKTTTARLLARALNCEQNGNKPTADPCGACPQCLAIGEDRHVDVLEVDAASRTGVDDVRELMDGVHYQPAFGRYKVYIIDEVHMLSKSAFNALLKTLEEPPAHVKFVFATTEIRKVPITVLSRCQRFDLQRVSPDVLIPYFSSLLEKEKIAFEEEALRLICKAADGSVRDGKSLLEQAIVGITEDRITETQVKDMLGLGDRSQMVDLLDLLLQGKVVESLEMLRPMLQKGASARQTLQDLMEVTHALSIMKVAGSKLEDTLAIPSSSLEKCQKMVEALSVPVLTRTWQILLKGLDEVARGPLPECALEMVLIRITHVKSFLSEGNGGGAQEKAPASQTVATQPVAEHQPQALAPKSTMPQNMPQDFKALVDLFLTHKEFILADKLKVFPSVQKFEEGLVALHIPEGTDTQFLREVSSFLKTWTGRPWNFELVDTPGGTNLHSQEKQEAKDKLAAVKEHPSVQSILKTFPDATIETIQ